MHRLHSGRIRVAASDLPRLWTMLRGATGSISKTRTGVREIVIPFEETLLVPDTMADMESILFAECSVSTSVPQGSRCGRDDSISGTITVYTVYRSSGSGDAPVDVIKSAIPFKSSKLGDTSEATYFIPAVTVRRCTSEMVNERKFTAKGELLSDLHRDNRDRSARAQRSPGRRSCDTAQDPHSLRSGIRS